MSDVHTFAGSALDRASAQRTDRRWLEAHLADDESRFLPLWKLQVLVRVGDPALAWARRELLESLEGGAEATLLGVRDQVAHFAVDVSALEKPETELGVDGAARFEDVRSAARQLPPSDAAIAAQARSVVDWHARHRFCAACGAATRPEQAGWLRRCAECAAEHFPRTDPVVIMLVSRGDRCLLARQARFPARFFSALAGFMEPGESIEEAVRREVREEADVRVGAVRYHSSQPWPFPSSLMIGCLAEGESDAITVDRSELEEARWFTRAEVRAAFAGEAEFSVPPPLAIAHHLIRAWLDEEPAA